MKLVFITGIAGFIGFQLQKELSRNYKVEGMDFLQPNKIASLNRSKSISNLFQETIQNPFLNTLPEKPDVLIHLAAETGISGSLTNPVLYFQQNVEGTFNVLEQCRKNGVKYFIYASSSSVYEPNQAIMSENSPHEKQLSFYGTSKRMTETMVENYCKQFGMTAIGLRFFTVYGSWTRPDMAAYKFMKAIENGESIKLYNDGKVSRDFTHVSDIVTAIGKLIEKIQTEKPGFHQVFNIGYGTPSSVKTYAECIAKNLDKQLKYVSSPLPTNELELTHCDTRKLAEYINFKPKKSIIEGVKEMTDWFKLNKYE